MSNQENTGVKTIVQNVQDGTFDPKNPMHVYIGRAAKYKGKWLKASPFANPYKTKHHTKEAHQLAVQHYVHYLASRPDLIEKIKELKGKTLYCWCKPLPCHGDILAILADSSGETTASEEDLAQAEKYISEGVPDIIEETCDYCFAPIIEGGYPRHFDLGLGWEGKDKTSVGIVIDMNFTFCSKGCEVASLILEHGLLYAMLDAEDIEEHLRDYHGLSQEEIEQGWEKIHHQNGKREPRFLTKIQGATVKAFNNTASKHLL